MIDPTKQWDGAAVTMHELFESFKRAGFSESQALYLVGVQLSALSKPPSV